MRIAILLFTSSLAALPQQLIKPNAEGSTLSLYYTDSAVLESGERRRDFPCEVRPIKPQLGFDLKFHSGYIVTFPFSELESDDLALITRVIPRGGEPSFLVQRVRSGSPRPTEGIGAVRGLFDIGGGSYSVSVVVRDAVGRVCSDFWESATEHSGSGLDLALEPGQIAVSEENPFAPEPAPARRTNALRAVRVLLNFAVPARAQANSFSAISGRAWGSAPAASRASIETINRNDMTSREADVFALLSIVRQIARHASPEGISLTVFNLEQRKVLYSQSGEIDFRALGEALQAFRPGTIDFDTLVSKDEGTAKFLAGLFEQSPSGERRSPIVVVSATDGVPDSFSNEFFPHGTDENITYLHYNPDPAAAQQYGDATGKAVKFLRGKKYDIGQPKDLAAIWPDFLSRAEQAVKAADLRINHK